jgi:hypothetical protein
MRGGSRPGSGRPAINPSDSKILPNHSIRCTPAEYELLKSYLKQLRATKK